jgi:hypothetical protein
MPRHFSILTALAVGLGSLSPISVQAEEAVAEVEEVEVVSSSVFLWQPYL